MNPFLSFIIRSFVAVPVTIITGFASFVFFDVHFLPSVGYAILGGVIVHVILSLVMTHQFLKKHQLSRKEYRYIQKNLAEASKKIRRLNKSLFDFRDLASVKQRMDIMRITKKIHKMAAKEPKRFYQAEPFYFSHLDSIVELTEKYSFLASQPKKNIEINQSLIETKQTLNEMTKVLEDDLYAVVSNDVDHLNFEIDVAKHSINRYKDSKFPDKNRWLK
ncbi:5-bromo-4-chloroindolyl phosphate hydrolysis family protein [Neobacillus dielmonensis]|uniref:5-bromo-4-chloroindolyl phosphate hydrolysis family protein n=1 Tax=Neobacillus dielmonensis TaxID=1347369 RepID=UPI0005A88D0B|nr:5-bromo-4-chloroindolyl phosphate hydrolysis family protein [Neobacillus dielmonensis]